MILKTRQGRYRVKVKAHGVIVADRTFVRWNDAEEWEADRKRHVAAGRLAPAAQGVQGILSHASPETTLRYYGHLTGSEHLRAAMDHYEASFTAGGQPSGGASGATRTPEYSPEHMEGGRKPEQ